nr:hypothetical protein BaRGS_014602 [Batillaria attramentaria]
MKTTHLYVTVVVLSSLAHGLTSDLFLSSAETAALLESEEGLLDFLYSWLQGKAARTGDAEYARLARGVARERNSVPVGQDAGHPLDALLGLTRFTGYWNKYIANADAVVAHSVEKSLAQNRIVYPDSDVIHNARLAIVRLQAAYNMTAGTLLASAAAHLSAEDAASLARVAHLSGFTAVAQSWWDVAGSLKETNADPIESVVQPGVSQPVEDPATQARHAKFYALCQDFQFADDTSVLRSESCKYTTGTVPVERWKTEVLSTDPYVSIVYDCVTDKEATIIVNKATHKLTRALTGATPEEFRLKIHRRLGKIAWLNDSSSTVLRRVSRRIERITGLHTSFRNTASFGEAFQVVNYGIGGHYIPHHDYFKIFAELPASFLSARTPPYSDVMDVYIKYQFVYRFIRFNDKA